MRLRPVDARAASRLQILYDSMGSWRKVGAHLKVNQGDCVHVVKGRRRANADMLKALDLVKPRKPGLSLPLTRSESGEILDWGTVPDSVRQRLIKRVAAYDKRNNRSASA